jgi:hypothetical protein
LAISLLLASRAEGQNESVEADALRRDPAPETKPEIPRKARKERDTDRFGWAVPDFAKLQSGGFAGLAALGGGYAAFNDILNVQLLYGFSPSAHSGVTVHSLHFAISGRPVDVQFGQFRLVPIYIGVGLLYTLNAGGYFVRVPKRYRYYDDRYYYPTALHWTADVGLEFDWVQKPGNFFERHGIYAELTALDSYIIAYFENPVIVAFSEAFSSGFGYRAAF